MQGPVVYGQGGYILLAHRAVLKVGDSRGQQSFTELITMATEHLGRSNDRMRASGLITEYIAMFCVIGQGLLVCRRQYNATICGVLQRRRNKRNLLALEEVSRTVIALFIIGRHLLFRHGRYFGGGDTEQDDGHVISSD